MGGGCWLQWGTGFAPGVPDGASAGWTGDGLGVWGRAELCCRQTPCPQCPEAVPRGLGALVSGRGPRWPHIRSFMPTPTHPTLGGGLSSQSCSEDGVPRHSPHTPLLLLDPKATSSPVTSTASTLDQVFLPLSEVTDQDFL